MKNNVQLKLKPASQIEKRLGIDPGGDIQRFHTQNVLRRIVKFMPYRTGATIKITVAQTDINKPYIVTDTPYAKYLYYGKVMAGPAPKTVTNRDLVYTKTKNPQAGPFWDRALVAAEGKVIERELQAYINRRGGGSR